MTLGMIHGRFQPFHNGHLDCLRWVSESCDKVIVGVTNPDIRDQVKSQLAPHRHTENANPFTYYERVEMILRAADQIKITPERLRTVPFFLNSPNTWCSYIPRCCIHYVTILSEWEASKALHIENEGYLVMKRHILRNISATDVRMSMAEGRSINHLVPEGVFDLINNLGRLNLRGETSMNTCISIEDLFERDEVSKLQKKFSDWRVNLDNQPESNIIEVSTDGISGVRLDLPRGFERFMSAWFLSNLIEETKENQISVAIAGPTGDFHRLVQFTNISSESTIYVVASGKNRLAILNTIISAVSSFDSSKFDSDGYLI